MATDEPSALLSNAPPSLDLNDIDAIVDLSAISPMPVPWLPRHERHSRLHQGSLALEQAERLRKAYRASSMQR